MKNKEGGLGFVLKYFGHTNGSFTTQRDSEQKWGGFSLRTCTSEHRKKHPSPRVFPEANSQKAPLDPFLKKYFSMLICTILGIPFLEARDGHPFVLIASK